MRISEAQHQFIINFWEQQFAEVKVYLFGSRIDDNLKGGDIDLAIVGNEKPTTLQRAKFKTGFDFAFGEQKVDLVYINPSKPTAFAKYILETAILLNE
jgi:predicted nucleotidyltransferase